MPNTTPRGFILLTQSGQQNGELRVAVEHITTYSLAGDAAGLTVVTTSDCGPDEFYRVIQTPEEIDALIAAHEKEKEWDFDRLVNTIADAGLVR